MLIGIVIFLIINLNNRRIYSQLIIRINVKTEKDEVVTKYFIKTLGALELSFHFGMKNYF